MRVKRAIAALLCGALTVGCTPVIFASNTIAAPYFSENFNQYISNATVAAVEVTNALKNRIVEDGCNNKALLVEGYRPILKKEFGVKITTDFVLSFDIKSIEDTFSFNAGVYTSDNTNQYLINVKDSKVVLGNGKVVSGMSKGRYTNFALIFHYDLNVYDIYVDKKLTASNIPVTGMDAFDGLIIQVTRTGEKTYFDNFMAYPSDSILEDGNIRSYNAEAFDHIDINDYTGSLEYWNSDSINSSNQRYQFVNLFPKTNLIETPRFDYKNKNRESWLKFTKTTSDDCYMDINVKRLDNPIRVGPPAQTYKYFVLSGDFMTEGGIQQALFPRLRDAQTYSSNAECDIAAIYGRNIKLADGTVIEDVVRPGEWFNYVLAIDLESQTVSVWINGDERAVNHPIVCANKAMKIEFLSLVRISLVNGNFQADLKMKNCKFTGYEKPFVYGEDPSTSIYYDDTPVAEYLRDKIAFHAYAKNVMINDVKYDLSDSMRYDENNDEIYVKASVLTERLGWPFPNPDEMVPVKQYASENTCYYSFSDKNGLIVLSETEMKLNTEGEYQWFVLEPLEGTSNAIKHTTQTAALNDYVFFDRPSAEQLLSLMNERTESLTAHPRIFADKNKFDEFRLLYQTDMTFKAWADVIIEEADGYANPDTPYLDYVYQDNYRMMSVTHAKYQDRFTALGFAWQMTGDHKYVDRAFSEFEMLFTFPDINPNHIIDTGCMNTGVALAYDWMYDGFTPKQRARIEEFVLTICIPPVADGFYGEITDWCAANVGGWYAFKTTNNYNTWVISGLLSAVCAFMECDTDYLSKIAEQSIRGLEYTVKGFAPDGGWVEGPDYWQHTVKYLALYAGTALNCFGSDFNILEYQGLEEAADWMMSITGLQGVNNFGDASNGPYTYDDYSFLSSYYGSHAIGSLRKWDIMECGNKPEIYDLLFYDPTVGTEELENLPNAIFSRGIESCGIRQSFRDDNAMFFSAAGGANQAYHSHYDTGAFIFDLNGVRWAWDLGKDDYNTGLSDWQMFRKRSEAHNTISINNAANFAQSQDPMKTDGFGRMKDYDFNDHSAYVTYDMSDVYDETDDYTRGFYIGDDYRSLTVRDEITVNTSSEIYWSMNTKAAVSLYGNEAMLEQDGEVLHVQVECDAKNWKFMDMPCESVIELPTGSTAQASNAEYTKLAIKVNSSGSFTITVRMTMLGEAADHIPVDTTPIAQWKLVETAVAAESAPIVSARIYADGKPVTLGNPVSIRSEGNMPVITVEPGETGADYEVVQSAESASEKTVIKVYNTDRSAYRIYQVTYTDIDEALWEDYDVLDVADFSVSQEAQPQNAGVNLFDRDFATRWTSLNEGEYVTIDLGEEKSVAAVAMGFWQSAARSYNYTVQASVDGKSYTIVDAGSSPMEPEGDYRIYSFSPIRARYVKIIGTGNTTNVNTNILELRVLGEKIGG